MLIPDMFSVILAMGIMIAIQVYLSKQNKDWVGYVLPILTAIFASILLYLGFMSGFANSLIVAIAMIVIFYLPSLALLFIHLRLRAYNIKKETV